MAAKKAAPATAAEPEPAAVAEVGDGLPDAGSVIALEPLKVGGVPAFQAGDRVPVGHVRKFGWRDKVKIDEAG